MKRKQWDAAVIGGGPAGSSAAISLARQGMDVLLIEASRYPHDKVCGEFISPEGLSTLKTLSHAELSFMNRAVSIRKHRITAPNGAVWEGQFPGEALSISRSVLDDELQQEAQRVGVEVRQAATVVEVNGSMPAGFQLMLRSEQGHEPVRAQAVIGAYGKRSRLDGAHSRAFFSKDQGFMALKAHFYGPSLEDRVELHAFPGGYCGLSDIEDNKRNVCLLVHQSVFRAAARGAEQPAEKFISWMRMQNQYLNNWLQDAELIHARWMAIAQIPFDRKETVVDDILMVGDAAGVIVPLAGDGISMALESGILAGELLSQYLHSRMTHPELLHEFQRMWRKKFHQRLWMGRMLQPLLLHPGASGVSIRLLSTLPWLGRYLVTHTRGEIVQEERNVSLNKSDRRMDG